MTLKHFVKADYRLPLLFATLSEYDTKALNIVRPRVLHLEATYFDKDGNVVIRPDFKLALAFYYKNRLLLLSAAGLTEPKLNIIHPISVNNSKM